MKKYRFKIEGKDYDVDILGISSHSAHVNVNGVEYEVELEKEIKTPKTPTILRPDPPPSTDSSPAMAKTFSPAEHKGTGMIKSPLPGIIREIFIRQGSQIRIGETLMVLEAMKMENNINSDKEGIVTEIKVNPGDSVLEGDVLVIIN